MRHGRQTRQFRSPMLEYSITPTLPCCTGLETNGMPGGFHLDGVEDPVRRFRLRSAPLLRSEITAHVAFHIEVAAALKFLAELFVPATVNDGVDIHVAGEM